MGWNSWNSFSNLIDAEIAMRQAKALVDSGMKAAGYEYVVIDEGWWKGTRDGEGNITVDPVQWPALKSGDRAGDMANIAAYIHGLGLKAGIYTDVGKYGCGYAGPTSDRSSWARAARATTSAILNSSQNGASTMSKWTGAGFGRETDRLSAVRRDCPGDPAGGVRHWAEAVFLHLRMGFAASVNWAPGVGGSAANIWRTGGDIVEPVVEQAQDEAHRKRIVTLKNVLNAFDAGVHPDAQHTGYYNDLDMMVVGMRGMTEPWSGSTSACGPFRARP